MMLTPIEKLLLTNQVILLSAISTICHEQGNDGMSEVTITAALESREIINTAGMVAS